MKSKRIINIEAKMLPDGGASVSCRINYLCPKDSAITAVAKSMLFLNEYCERMELGIVFIAHDPKTNAPLYLKMT
jgi:hypothetical protein